MHLEGTWKIPGYSKLFQFEGNRFSIYDMSAVSCVEAACGSMDEFYAVFDRFERNPVGEVTFFARGGITRYTMLKQNHFPRDLLQRNQDVSYNFEVFWRYFEENYAFFELRGMDWKGVLRTWQPRLAVNASLGELLNALKMALVQLNDSHATLSAGDVEITTKKPHALVRQWQQEFNSTEFLGLYARGIPRLHAAIQENLLRGEGKSALQGQLLWGQLGPQVGYIASFSLMDIFGGFDQLHFAGFEVTNQVYLQKLESAMDEIMADMVNMRSVILDVRFNLGGHDAAGLAVASRFADRERLVLTKQARLGQGFTTVQEIFLQPAAGPLFTRPTVVLTSEATASAAEVLVHAMMALPHVTRVGETTRGVLSDMLVMRLPNGWKVSLSNEVYRAADGNCYEGRGVPPQLVTTTFVEHAFYESLHLTIDRALESLGLGRKP